MSFLDRVFKRKVSDERDRELNDERDIRIGKTEFRNFNSRAAIRKAPELATDPSLQCRACGRRPLFKKYDLMAGSYLKGSRLEAEVKKFHEAVAHMHAVQCVSCLGIYCFGCCVSKAAAGKRCPACGGELEQVAGAKREKPEASGTKEENEELARKLAQLLHRTHHLGDEADLEITKIGKYLSDNGGHERMLKVHARVQQLQMERGDARLLEMKWWG